MLKDVGYLLLLFVRPGQGRHRKKMDMERLSTGFSDPRFLELGEGPFSLWLGGCFPLIAPSIVDRLALASVKGTTKPWTATPPTTLDPHHHHSRIPPIVVSDSVSSLIIVSLLPQLLEPSR
jgi:hypothetical protein